MARRCNRRGTGVFRQRNPMLLFQLYPIAGAKPNAPPVPEFSETDTL